MNITLWFFLKIVGYKSIRELRINRSFNNVRYLLSIPLQIEKLVDFGCFTLILFYDVNTAFVIRIIW